MTILLDDILRTSVNFTLGDGSQYQNVYHHQRVGASGISDAAHVTAIADAFEVAYDSIANRVKATVVAALSSVDKVEFVDGAWKVTENIGVFTLSFTGSDAGEAYANQISPYILLKTLRPKTVGRKFMFPFTEAYYDGSIINGTLVTSLVNFADDILADIYLGPIDDLEPGVPRTGVDAWYPFTLGVVTNVCGSQRRRRPGVGS